MIHIFLSFFFRSDWLNLFPPAVFLLSPHRCSVRPLGQKAHHPGDSGECHMLILVMASQHTVEGTMVSCLAQELNCDTLSSALELNFQDLLVVDSFLPSHLATLPSVSA